MNILFMIGNGFDLNFGLKTRFSDFFTRYTSILNKCPNIKKFKEVIDDDISTWADFEMRLGRYTQDFTPVTKEIFLSCIDDFEKEFIKYLKEEELKIDYGKHGAEILPVFQNSLVDYFSRLEDGSKNAIGKSYAKAGYPPCMYNFISFNYTNILDSCLDIVRKTMLSRKLPNGRSNANSVGRILHIHGTLDKHMLIGVDNASQIENTALASDKEFAKLFLKPSMNDNLRNGIHEDGAGLVNASTIICVFGMSLGETDKHWWQKLGEWLGVAEIRQLVIFHYEKDYIPASARESIRFADDISNLFFDRADISDADRADLRPRIHVGLNTNLFKVDWA
ncbi:MAG: bacteriophage abortive infection AbiH family protein [Defluviitaleaceae bacterium]|nr:bacteriophage abortive infection AbiH family protein [Defluviitaleaceae bacterium]